VRPKETPFGDEPWRSEFMLKKGYEIMRRIMKAALGVLALGSILAIGAPEARADHHRGYGGYGGYGGHHGGGYGGHHGGRWNPGPFPPRFPYAPYRPYYGGYGVGYGGYVPVPVPTPVPVPVPSPYPVPYGVGSGLSVSVGIPW
jgi:hypothetical protein